jgi:hypothetical protein
MLLIDKHLIKIKRKNMKTIIKVSLLSVMAIATVGCATQNAATPLELRMMQTRQFNKEPREIVDAIVTNCRDAGGRSEMTMPWNIADTETKANVKSKNPSVVNKDQSFEGIGNCALRAKKDSSAQAKSMIPYIGGILAAVDANEALKNASSMDYRVKTDAKMTYTLVRMRVYNSEGEQITDPKVYSDWFAKIGDAVHIQAIPITANTQE